MDNQYENIGSILIVSASESFLANSLASKIRSGGQEAVMVHYGIKELEKYREQTELVILFLSENMEAYTDSLVYLKDMASDLDRRIILIGDTATSTDYRNNGYASTLVRHITQKQLSLGKSVYLYRDKKTAFYGKIGFESYGNHSQYRRKSKENKTIEEINY